MLPDDIDESNQVTRAEERTPLYGLFALPDPGLPLGGVTLPPLTREPEARGRRDRREPLRGGGVGRGAKDRQAARDLVCA